MEDGCGLDKYRMIIQCLVCHNDVVTKPSVDRKFCSKACHNQHQTKRALRSTCPQCGVIFNTTPHKSKFCSKSCNASYQNLRRTYKKTCSDYRRACVFAFNPELYPSKFDTSLIKQIGWYSRTTNPDGLVKDHMVSVKYGFDNNIPIEVINHPATVS